MSSLALPVALLIAAVAPAAVAPDPSLRSAEAVLDDYAKAVGGEAAWKRHKSMRMKRKVEVQGMQIGGTEERYATSAGKVLSVISIPGMGSFRQGSDGKVYWSEDPINGLRILEGAEAEEAKIDATWNGELQLKKLYQKVRSVPPPSPPPAGERHECVELVLKLAKPAIACFDAKTHLRVLQKGVHATPQGEVPYTVTFTDWREVEGMKIPFTQVMSAGPVTFTEQMEEVKFDEKLDPKLFALPKPGKAAEERPAKKAPAPAPSAPAARGTSVP